MFTFVTPNLPPEPSRIYWKVFVAETSGTRKTTKRTTSGFNKYTVSTKNIKHGSFNYQSNSELDVNHTSQIKFYDKTILIRFVQFIIFI